MASEGKQNWQFVHLDIRPSFFLISILDFPHLPLNSWHPSCLPYSYPDAIKSSSNVQYFLHYKLYAMFSIFFFHSTRETLLNREHESEWLIHKWDPDSVIRNADATVSSSAKVANILPSAFKTNRYPSVLDFMIYSCKNARRRGWRHSCLEAFKHRAENLTHGGDHTGRVVRSKGEAGRRVHRRRSGQHVAGVAEGRNVAEGGHVSGEGGWVEGAALGEVLQCVMYLFALFGFARHFSVSGLDAFLLHSQGSVNLNKDQFFFFFYFVAGSETVQAFPLQHRSLWLPSSGLCSPGAPSSHPILPPSRGPKGPQARSAAELWLSASISFRNQETIGKVFQAEVINHVHPYQSFGGNLPAGTLRSQGPHSRDLPIMTVFP